MDTQSQRPTSPPLLFTPDEAAARLGIGKEWLLDEARAGRIPARKLGRAWRFSEEDLQAIVAASARGQVDLNPWGFSRRAAGRRRSA